MSLTASHENKSMNGLLSFVRSVAAAMLALAAFGAAAQTFNAEVRVSNIVGPSIHPNVTASGSDVYVVWSENFLSGGSYYGDILVSHSADGGATFQTPVNITNTPTTNDQLPIIASSGTNVYVFWTDDPVSGELWYSHSTNSGATFSTPVKLSNSVNGYSRPGSVIVDSGGRVHLAYYDSGSTGGAYGQIYYSCSADNGSSWSTPLNISQYDGAVDAEAPRLAQATDGTLYVLFRGTGEGMPFPGFPPFDQFMLRSSAPVSGCNVSWLHPPQKVSPGLPAEFVNTYGGFIVPGSNNRLHAIYWADKLGTNLYYRRGNPQGKGWETVTDISGFGASAPGWDSIVAERSDVGIGEDGAGNLHVVFGDNNHLRDGVESGSLYYRCSADAGTTWVPRILVTSNSETAQARAFYFNNKLHIVWMDWRDNNTGAEIYYRNVTTGTCSASTVQAGLSPGSVAFGGMSMGTTSPAQAVTLTNTGAATLTISSISTDNTQFGQTNNCTSLAPGASCTINVTFTPAPAAGALNSTTSVSGNLLIYSNAAGSPNTVGLSGTGEKSLITHFYWSALRRAPDSGGMSFWQGEAVRMQGLGANVNETWYAMAMYFFNSAEYVGFGRNDAGFVTDLYNTFFNRPPDSGGLSYWTGQIAQGMPREVVLVSFMISTEFTTFAQNIFGNTSAYPEVDMVGDFYRGILARLPDTSGFNSWVGSFRTAQCSGNVGPAVYATVESISSGFINGAEYVGRNRTNAQFVGDLYNAFLRRGGDLAGVQYWINQLNTNAETRDQLRVDFKNSAEFSNRVANVIAAGCH